MKRQEKAWFEQVFDSVDFAEAGRFAGVDLEKEPKWVFNVLKELAQQTMPAVNIRKPGKITSRFVGQCVGQMCANLYALGDAFSPVAAAKPKQVERVLRTLLANQRLPAVQSLLEASEFASTALMALAGVVDRFDNVVMEGFKAALDQPNRAEAAEYFKGFATGISTPGLTSNRRPAKATTATVIYNRLFIERRRVERLKSVRELREFFLERGLSEQVLGDPKRLEKICERIGLSFGTRGRRKRAK